MQRKHAPPIGRSRKKSEVASLQRLRPHELVQLLTRHYRSWRHLLHSPQESGSMRRFRAKVRLPPPQLDRKLYAGRRLMDRPTNSRWCFSRRIATETKPGATIRALEATPATYGNPILHMLASTPCSRAQELTISDARRLPDDQHYTLTACGMASRYEAVAPVTCFPLVRPIAAEGALEAR